MRLDRAVAAAVRGGADAIHVDVMDGHFVPNLSMGPHVVACLRKATRLPLDVHLMVTDPARHVGPFLRAGASNLTIHAEARGDIPGLLRHIRRCGARASICLKPEVPLRVLGGLWRRADMVLLMTVHPGYGGQRMMRTVLPKVRALRELASLEGNPLDIEVDGGITLTTVGEAVRAGANVIVAGVSVFGSRNPASSIRRIRAVAERAGRMRA